MIKSITVINHLGESLAIDIFKPEKSGFLIKKIDGLGPVKTDVNMTDIATADGAIDNSARLQKRNIVLYLMFWQDNEENLSIEDLRLKTYRYFPDKQIVTFRVETDSRVAEVYGRIESNEPDIFSEKEGCQISIVCGDPFFYSIIGRNKTILSGVDPLFEFPFSNESLDEPLLNFGEILLYTEGSVHYVGDSETGIVITFHAIGPVSGIVIYDIDTKGKIKILDDKLTALTGSGIIAGDNIIINTNRGSKSAYLLRNGVYTNILNTLERPASWFQISKGDNLFAFTAEEGLLNLRCMITNDVVYDGV